MKNLDDLESERAKTRPCPALRYDIEDKTSKCFITGVRCQYLCKENCLDYQNYIHHTSQPRIVQTKRWWR